MRTLARQNGMKFMQEYALDLVRDGVTAFEEAQRVIAFEAVTVDACGSCGRELSPNFVFCPFCGVKRFGKLARMPTRSPAVKRQAVNK
jgi:hypothetical protein